MDKTVIVTRHDNWAIIRINRQAKRNALDRTTRTQLRLALTELEDARAVILTGSADSFCAGLDLKECAKDKAEDKTDTAGQEWIALNLAIREHPAIFIAAVNGLALGGGVTLINICDLALASSSAMIACPELGFATYASVAGPTSQLLISRKRAAWLLLTTNQISAQTAERWGLINEVTEPEALLTRAGALATQIASFNPVALSETKRALEEIPAKITQWRDAMEFGQTVNMRIRDKLNAAPRS